MRHAARHAAALAGGLLLHGQTNFVKSLWKFNSVYDAAKLFYDHCEPVRYEIPARSLRDRVRAEDLYVQSGGGRRPSARARRRHCVGANQLGEASS
ncbi:MAG: hypothetical protein ACRETZ_05500 [Steroidobacteraceae bacterium]